MSNLHAMPERRPDQNPMIGSTPRETIEHVVGALQWLNALDNHVGDAFGGEPIDSITFGRFLLGKCCTEALTAAAHELERKDAGQQLQQ